VGRLPADRRPARVRSRVSIPCAARTRQAYPPRRGGGAAAANPRCRAGRSTVDSRQSTAVRRPPVPVRQAERCGSRLPAGAARHARGARRVAEGHDGDAHAYLKAVSAPSGRRGGRRGAPLPAAALARRRLPRFRPADLPARLRLRRRHR
jgi:hypothetical protein